jgi:predicted MFS family arabinose efflux permease
MKLFNLNSSKSSNGITRTHYLLHGKLITGLAAYGIITSLVVVGTSLLNYYVLAVLLIPPVVAGTLFGIGSALAVPVTFFVGYAGIRFGAPKVIVATIIISSISYVGFALIHFMPFFGILYAIAISTDYVPQVLIPVIILQHVEEENAGKTLGTVNSVGAGLAIAGASVAGWIAHLFGFSTLFFVVAGITLTSALMLGLTIGSSGNRSGHGDRVKIQRPVIKLRELLLFILKNKYLLLASFAVMILATGLFADKFYTLYAFERFDAASYQIAFFDSIYFAVWFVASAPVGFISDKIGPKRVTMLGYGLMGVSLFLFPFAGTIFLLYGFYTIFSLGNVLGYYIIFTGIRTVDKENASLASGIINGFTTVGVAISGPVGGFLWTYIGARNSFEMAIPTSIVAIFLLLSVKLKKEVNVSNEKQ